MIGGRHKMVARLLGFGLLVASFVIGGAWIQLRVFMDTPLSLPDSGLVLDVPEGATVTHLARNLSDSGAMASPWKFRWAVRWDERANRIKTGEYRLESGTTPNELLALLVAGRSISYRVTLIEGWNFRQVRAALARDPVLVQTLAGLGDDEIMAALGKPGQHPEGRFFPDTYLFPRGTRDVDVLRRAHQRMTEELAAAWADREADLPLKTADEALTLASIVEKETAVPAERAEIAGVFIRRLRKGMKLQTDPTVIYGMGENFDGNIRRRDLRRDTPYNTYTRRGLPPTPICMPGKEAIVASLHPAEGDAIFFVAKGDGSHYFSATLKEHNAAVRKYQLKK